MGKFLLSLLFNTFLLALACVVAGCGGGGNSSASGTTTVTVATTTTVPVTTSVGVTTTTTVPVTTTSSVTTTVPSDPLNNWHWRNPLPQGNTLNGVTYGNGIFVAVGDAGTILTSADGITWTSGTSGTNSNLYGVAYGNEQFVAVGGRYDRVGTNPWNTHVP